MTFSKAFMAKSKILLTKHIFLTLTKKPQSVVLPVYFTNFLSYSNFYAFKRIVEQLPLI